MTIRRNNSFTALNASIKFDEFDIGGLQEISINEMWNTKQINALGSRIPSTIVPGFFQGEVTARRAFVEKNVIKDIFTFHLKPLISKNKMQNVILKDEVIDSSKNIDVSLIKNGSQFFNVFNDFSDNLEDWNNLFFSLSFNIAIKDENDKEIILIRDCVLETKKTTISQSGIIIMEDLSFKFTQIQKNI